MGWLMPWLLGEWLREGKGGRRERSMVVLLVVVRGEEVSRLKMKHS